ncbi:hypothetical protein IMZ11_38860 [Microtetraspora sp. AC03309]|uniref:hypothetical protein n=1 Tax=Microtetraspora sp. AC03309 TaxID=2779376 RepID=UPI001E34775C|nr:hypothetical protein [Microtetraspora sp. AC03309]MCC5581580.1 hypothetical protein [Microtetraspora sp. AC03309]
MTITVGVGGAGSRFSGSTTSGENSTFSGPHGGAGAQGGAGGELASKYSGGHGGKGGILFGWGGDSGPGKGAFAVGRAGTSSSSGKGGAEGAPVGVPKSCPTSTGVGGNGCVVITY